jgi:hypothetical protein
MTPMSEPNHMQFEFTDHVYRPPHLLRGFRGETDHSKTTGEYAMFCNHLHSGAVAEQQLDYSDVGAGFQKMGGKAMPERSDRDFFIRRTAAHCPCRDS